MRKLIFLSLALMSLWPISSAQAEYLDVDDNEKYAEAIDYISTQKIVSGYIDGTFRPEKILNRAELLKIVVEANFTAADFDSYVNTKCFTDIEPMEWYVKYVCFAKDKGIIEGYEDGSFRPNAEINLVEALKITMEVFDYKYPESDPWFQGFVNRAADYNFIPTDFSGFEQKVRRDQMAELITRVLKLRKGELPAYLGNMDARVVSFESLSTGKDVESIKTVTFSDVTKNLSFDQEASWPAPVYADNLQQTFSINLAPKADFAFEIGPKMSQSCEGEDCRGYLLYAYHPQSLAAVLEVIKSDATIELVDNNLIEGNRVLVLESNDNCTDLQALIFGGKNTFILSAKCVGAMTDRTNFYLILNSLTVPAPLPTGSTTAPEVNEENETSNENTVVDLTTQELIAKGFPNLNTKFVEFISNPFLFKIRYPSNLYYRGVPVNADGVTHRYEFSKKSFEDLLAEEVPVVEITFEIMSAAPPLGESLNLLTDLGFDYAVKVVGEDGTVNIYVTQGKRNYRLRAAGSYADVLLHMAASIQKTEAPAAI